MHAQSASDSGGAPQLPILLHGYNPSMRLEWFGLLLGVIGMTLSPVLLFGALAYLVYNEWR